MFNRSCAPFASRHTTEFDRPFRWLWAGPWAHAASTRARKGCIGAARLLTVGALLAAFVGGYGMRSVVAQNDWQFPDPYFGVPQPANPAAPAIQRRYRTEIGPPAVRRQAEQLRPTPGLRRYRQQRGRSSGGL